MSTTTAQTLTRHHGIWYSPGPVHHLPQAAIPRKATPALEDETVDHLRYAMRFLLAARERSGESLNAIVTDVNDIVLEHGGVDLIAELDAA